MVGAPRDRLLSALRQIWLLGPVISRMGRERISLFGFKGKASPQDWAYLKELLETGKLVPVIERCYPLSQTAEAIRYLQAGHARGKVVSTVDQNNPHIQSLGQNTD